MRHLILATIGAAIVSATGLVPEVALGQSLHRDRDTISTPHIGTDNSIGQELLHRMNGSLVLLVFFRMEDPLAIKALEHAKKLWRVYRGRGLRVFGVHSPPEGWHAPRSPGEEPVDTKLHPKKGLTGTPENTSETMKARSGRPPRKARLSDDVAKLRVRSKYAAPMTSLSKRHGIAFPILLDHDNAIWRKYGLNSYPAFLHIQPDGRPVSTLVGAIPYGKLFQTTHQLLHE